MRYGPHRWRVARARSAGARLELRLVRVPYHRGVKECSGFEGVFLRKVGADQKPAVFAEMLIGKKVPLELFKTVKKEVTRLLMAVVKLAHDVAQEEIDFLLRERHQPRQDPLDSLRAGWLERSDHDSAVGGPEHNTGAPYYRPDAAHGLAPRRRLS